MTIGCCSKTIRAILVVSVILAGTVGFAARHYGVYSWRDYEVYRAMSFECHPVWRDFHFGRIGPGADLEEVVASTKPKRVNVYGDFAVLDYQSELHFTGVGATAYKGRLVEAGAWSCCWNKTFFNTMTNDDKQHFQEQYEIVMKPICDRQNEEEANARLVEEKNKEREDP